MAKKSPQKERDPMADTVNRLPSDQARFVRESVTTLIETERLNRSVGEKLLESTG